MHSGKGRKRREREHQWNPRQCIFPQVEHNKALWISNKTKKKIEPTDIADGRKNYPSTPTSLSSPPNTSAQTKQKEKPCLYIMSLSLQHRDICKCKIYWNEEWCFTFLGNLILYQCILLCNTENTKVPSKQHCLLFSIISKGTRIKLRTDLEKETYWFFNAKNLLDRQKFS